MDSPNNIDIPTLLKATTDVGFVQKRRLAFFPLINNDTKRENLKKYFSNCYRYKIQTRTNIVCLLEQSFYSTLCH